MDALLSINTRLKIESFQVQQQTVLDTDDFDIDSSNGKLVLQPGDSDKAWAASAGSAPIGGSGDTSSSLPNSVPVVPEVHQV